FCDDIVTGNSLCIHRIIQNNTTEFHDEICTLFSDGLSYEISRYKDAKLDNNRKLGYESQLAIKAVTRKDLSRLLSTHFLPLEEADNKGYACFAMTGDIQLINQEPVDNLSSISVRQVNNILTVESTIKNIIGCARYSIDMERGGMPIECLATIDGKGFHWQCKLQNCDGIWIPEETSFVSINSDDTFYCYKYLWKENTINAKIPADTFSLNSLGVHRGTVVYDYRTGYEQILSDSEFPSMPQYYVEKIKRSPVAGIALVVAIIIAIITILAIIVRIVMRFYNKRKCNISEE
ncbi:MAG: hypothetical protein LBE18_10840, partial [Planctomycetaceae bacterium]|nr:hypothetical protein [Planctomycetaceae bacterium]